MTKFRAILLAPLLLAAAFAPPAASASEAEGKLPSAQVDLTDKAALQRGAALYMNYCSGCHSLKYHRYSRSAEDLGLTEAEVQDNLIFSEARIGDTMGTAMAPADAEKWLGKAPPDLSVEARTKEAGGDWIYAYLKSFYVDESRPTGWNNTVFPGASMPNVLWEMQGVQHAAAAEAGEGHAGAAEGHAAAPACPEGSEARAGTGGHGFCIPEAQKGSLTADQFDRAARDIAAYLAYVGEPAAIKRESIGVWVVLFLAFFTFLAYLLKTEYWRDVH
jgi:ubiquinol-cytochrome c reductase cytochrome c1 subunit